MDNRIYYLDVRRFKDESITFPENTPDYIPIRKGRWFKEWDVVEEMMPVGWRGKLWLNKIKHKKRGNANMCLPTGFDIWAMPKGVKILNKLPEVTHD